MITKNMSQNNTYMLICHLIILDMYTHIYVAHEITGMNYMTRNIALIIFKYVTEKQMFGYHINANILYGHINPISLNAYAKIQTTAMSTPHVIAKYMPVTNVLTNWAYILNI